MAETVTGTGEAEREIPEWMSGEEWMHSEGYREGYAAGLKDGRTQAFAQGAEGPHDVLLDEWWGAGYLAGLETAALWHEEQSLEHDDIHEECADAIRALPPPPAGKPGGEG